MYHYKFVKNGNPLQQLLLENPMDRGVWQAAVHGVTKSRIRLSIFIFIFHFPLSCIGEGNGNPLQYSCLENPRDGGAWWAAVYGVAQSRTRLKRRSSSSSIAHTTLRMNPKVNYGIGWLQCVTQVHPGLKKKKSPIGREYMGNSCTSLTILLQI